MTVTVDWDVKNKNKQTKASKSGFLMARLWLTRQGDLHLSCSHTLLAGLSQVDLYRGERSQEILNFHG